MPSGAIETAADNAPAIAIAVSRVAVTGAIAIAVRRVTIARAITVAVSRIAIASAIAIAAPTVACAIVTGSGSGRAVESCTSNGVIAEIGTDAIGAAHRAAMNARNAHWRQGMSNQRGGTVQRERHASLGRDTKRVRRCTENASAERSRAGSCYFEHSGLPSLPPRSPQKIIVTHCGIGL